MLSHAHSNRRRGHSRAQPAHPTPTVRPHPSDVRLYRHDKTGAEVISVVNSDENKTFGAVLRTPVDDSKGVPHILEHRHAARGGWVRHGRG